MPTLRVPRRFTIRALLLLTAAAAMWLGWEAHGVRTRRQLIRDIEDGGGYVFMPDRNIPWYRRQMGDQVADQIWLTKELYATLEARLHQVFPGVETHQMRQIFIEKFKLDLARDQLQMERARSAARPAPGRTEP